MKRISLQSLLVLLSLCIGIAAMSMGNQPKLPTPKWQKVPNSPPRVEWWRTHLSDNEPEVAVLRIPDAEYQTFVADSMKYLNDHHILFKDTNKVQPCYLMPPGKPGGTWTIIIIHTPNSTVNYVASQQP